MVPAERSGQDQAVRDPTPCHPAVRADQPDQVLAGLERAHEQEVGTPDLQPEQDGLGVGRGGIEGGRERHHVEPVGLDRAPRQEVLGGGP
jgi:hypothetical protein